MDICPIGISTSALDRQPASVTREAAGELEWFGYRAPWVGEAACLRRSPMRPCFCRPPDRKVVVTGIASIWACDPTAMVVGQCTLAEAWGVASSWVSG